MNIADKDLNLLVVFLSIWEERNLSRVGEKLHISQSAVSHALSRLREQFNDSLFVRGSKGVIPTEFTHTLIPKVYQIVYQVNELYTEGKIFNPKDSKRTINLAIGEYFHTGFMRKFSNLIKEEAPEIKIICYSDVALLNPEKFENGEIDIAVSGLMGLELKEGFYTKEVIKDRISCLSDPSLHLEKSLSLKNYLKLEHVFVSDEGKTSGYIDRNHLGKSTRKISRVVSTFTTAATLVKESELILTGPDRILKSLAKYLHLQVSDLHFINFKLPIHMYWHQRTHKDSFCIWVRDKIQEVLKET
jgi:DNA-binding transcriptional LysR family regulator